MNQPTVEPSPTIIQSPSPTPTHSSATIAPATNTPTPTLHVSTPPSISIDEFRYANSSTKSSNSTSLTLESTDDSDTITNWYKEKIKSAGMNTKSFVTTKTNGNVLNKLVGANGKTQIRVEISKSAGSDTVEITVTVSTS